MQNYNAIGRILRYSHLSWIAFSVFTFAGYSLTHPSDSKRNYSIKTERTDSSIAAVDLEVPKMLLAGNIDDKNSFGSLSLFFSKNEQEDIREGLLSTFSSRQDRLLLPITDSNICMNTGFVAVNFILDALKSVVMIL